MTMNFRSKRIVVLFFALIFVLVAAHAHAVDPIRKFQIDVIAINTSFGTPSVTESSSRAIIEKVNEGYRDATGGLITFTLRSVLTPITAKIPVIDSGDVKTATGINPTADSGYEKAILIGVVSRNPNVKWAGIAGGNFMWINGNWDTDSAEVVSHELGHNLGLMHANSAVCTATLPVSCDDQEYGDYSSTMGTFIYGNISQPYVTRFSAIELDLLKVLPENKKIVAASSGEFKLAPVYSQGIDLPKLIYVPIGNEYIYGIEYRPAVGADSALAQTQLSKPGVNSIYSNTPSHGLQLRVMRGINDAYSSIQPKFSNLKYFGTGLVSDTLTGAQLQPVGKTFTLSDGSTVTFVSADPNVGAVVKVVRPADSEAPRFSNAIARWEPSTYWITATGERLIRKKNPTEWDFPVIEIPLNGILDNRLVKKIALEVNGKVVQEINDLSLIRSDSLKYQTAGEGKFDLRLTATDYAGNVGASAISSLTTTYTRLAKPGVVSNQGKDPYTSIKFSFYRSGADTSYKLSELSSGKIESIDEVNQILTITVIDITRNSNFSAKLTGTNPAGYSDDGQVISGQPRKYEIKPPFVQVLSGDDPYTMVNLKFTNACETCKYSISNLSSGKVKSVESTNGVTSIVIEEIKRNQRIKATLTGNDSFGFSDGGQEISADPSFYEIPQPSISYRSGSDPRTSVVITFRDACATCTYSVVDLAGGVVTKTEKVNDQNLITISNISRNSGFKATLIGNDAYGFNDSGQEISKDAQDSVCDNSLCYQGMDWVVVTGYWVSGTGNMSLQELVKGKWVTVKTAKPIAAKNNLPKYPNTFAITIKNVSTGKRTYRLSISAKGKYSAYVGKSFVQVVKP